MRERGEGESKSKSVGCRDVLLDYRNDFGLILSIWLKLDNTNKQFTISVTGL